MNPAHSYILNNGKDFYIDYTDLTVRIGLRGEEWAG